MDNILVSNTVMHVEDTQATKHSDELLQTIQEVIYTQQMKPIEVEFWIDSLVTLSARMNGWDRAPEGITAYTFPASELSEDHHEALTELMNLPAGQFNQLMGRDADWKPNNE